ncbi:MAG TPA: glycoside hydrolase family 2 TIM barrel-domain containing protein [Gemmatimonadales bacterium]|nr:glycoside hydrolase family 2 TIM barrel-domain containing protein [Gemmatimonadales bacterium]
MAPILSLPLLSVLLLGSLDAPPRDRVSMDAGWRFALGDHPGASEPSFNDRGWRLLDVPHDWSVEGTPAQDAPAGGRGGFFPTGIGWYRKSFTYGKPGKDERVTIEFDGVYMNSEVWLNGVRLGLRPFGYIGFEYDLTPHLRPGRNVLAVRVDNSAQPNSRWYSGSGIYRHVWLNSFRQIHIPRDGITVTTPRVTPQQSDVLVRTEVTNGTGETRSLIARAKVLDRSGNIINEVKSPVEAPPGATVALMQVIPRVPLKLWSVEQPVLYRLQVEILDGKVIRDRRELAFGVRTAEFDKDRGFLLNGQQVKLRGVNLHHEAGALGAAVPEQVWESRLRKLKAMGVNAIRTSHNPTAPEFMDLCDRLGFLVMDEAFDEWTFGKVPEGYHKYFAEWSERDVVDFVRRDRNHPSVVLWSAGNEIGEQGAPDGVKVLQRLLDLFHREDPTRPVTTGNDNIVADGGPARLEFLEALDIVGYNYVDRWHERRELFAEQDRHDHPEWKLIGTESGSIFQSFDEQYSLGDDPAVPKPNYVSGMFQVERLWKWVTLRDWFSGSFMWTGIDYLGEAVWPFKGFPSGALDITGEPKDAFYLYQGLWSDQPVLHLFPHWNWPGREGQVIPVLAYTNCNVVELFVNGKSYGEQRKEFPAQGTSGGWNSYAKPQIHPTTGDLHFRWDVEYQPGRLVAVCKDREGVRQYERSLQTAGPVRAIQAVAERDTITSGMGDVAIVRLSMVDSVGTVVPSGSAEFCVRASNGDVIAIDNANLMDLAPYRKDCGRMFNGKAIVIARPRARGTMQIDITSSGLIPVGSKITVMGGQ